MLRALTIATLLSLQTCNSAGAFASFDASRCTLSLGDKSFVLHGSYQVVESFPDFKVQVVRSFADLKVQRVNSFADSCGEWTEVSSFPDFKIQFVTSFPDLQITYVDSFPGAN
jgi:hypothetical protein